MSNEWLWDIDGMPVTDECKWNRIRQYRNELIAKCDWTQLPDCPLTGQEIGLWLNYRQELRDLPSVYDSPESVIFPTEPKES